MPSALQEHPRGWLINTPGVEQSGLNSPAATADNCVYLTGIRLGGDGAEKASNRQLVLNAAVRCFCYCHTNTNLF